MLSKWPLLISLALIASQAQAQVPDQRPDSISPLTTLAGHLIADGKSYDYDRQLADGIGPRLTGSANYLKAADWATANFTRLGLVNVHREPFLMPTVWEPESAVTAHITAPREQTLHMVSEGWSPSTPLGGVQANVFYLPALNPAQVKHDAAKIRGSVVLIDWQSVGDELIFGDITDAIHLLSAEGAQGILFGMGRINNSQEMIGNGLLTAKAEPIPAGSLGLEDTLLLKRMLKDGPVRVQFQFSNRLRENVKVDNVVAEIPGTDADGEYVLLGAHLDSWHLGTGAEDNGTGVATLLGIAQAIQASGLKPRRTMRFVLFGGEEQLLIGSRAYAREHASELDKCVGVFITDTGSEPPVGWYTFGRKDEDEALIQQTPVLAELGAESVSTGAPYIFRTDEAPFVVRGVPSFVLWTGMSEYDKFYHSYGDTFDKVNQRDLNLGASVVGLTAFAFANSPQRLPHFSESQVQQQLETITAGKQYRDLKSHNFF